MAQLKRVQRAGPVSVCVSIAAELKMGGGDVNGGGSMGRKKCRNVWEMLRQAGRYT